MRLCGAKARRFLYDIICIRPFKVNTRRFQSFLPSPATWRPTPCLNSGTILEILMTSLTTGPEDYTHIHINACAHMCAHQVPLKYPVCVNVPIVSINVCYCLSEGFSQDLSNQNPLILVWFCNTAPDPGQNIIC